MKTLFPLVIFLLLAIPAAHAMPKDRCDARLYSQHQDPFSIELDGTRVARAAALAMIARIQGKAEVLQTGDRFVRYPVYELERSRTVDAFPKECSYTKVARILLSCANRSPAEAVCAEFCDFFVNWEDCR
jgi:hypothetical protein